MDDDVEIEIREVDADFADNKNEDQNMEEGELSDENNEPTTDKFRQLKKRSLADRLGPKLNPRRSYAEDSEERARSRLPVIYLKIIFF